MKMADDGRGRRKSRSDRLFETAALQAGYFTARQALQAGYSYRLHNHHKKVGNWISVGHGLYRLRHYPEVEDEEFVRLSLWSRDRNGDAQAAISHETALRLHGLTDLMPDRTHLCVPSGFRKRAPRGVVLQGVVLHKATLERQDIEDRGGYSVTTPLRTVLDIARSPRVSPEHLEAAVAEALEHGLVRRGRLLSSLGTIRDRGRRRLVERLISDDSPPSEQG